MFVNWESDGGWEHEMDFFFSFLFFFFFFFSKRAQELKYLKEAKEKVAFNVM